VSVVSSSSVLRKAAERRIYGSASGHQPALVVTQGADSSHAV